MAAKQNSPDASKPGAQTGGNAPELLEISELKRKYRTGRAVYAGVCAAQGWRPGRKLTEEEYAAAVEQFTGGRMDGRPGSKSKTKEAGK